MRWSLLALALFVLSADTAQPNGQVDSQDEGIQIIRQARESPKGDFLGYAYWVRNTNTYSVRFQMQLTNEKNALNGLIQGTIVVPANHETYLGTVMRQNPSKPYDWDYTWHAEQIGNHSAIGLAPWAPMGAISVGSLVTHSALAMGFLGILGANPHESPWHLAHQLNTYQVPQPA